MKQIQEVSRGIYTYRHHCGGGVDIHDIFVKKSVFRVLLSYVGAIFLLASVCHAFLLKEPTDLFKNNSVIQMERLCLGSFWSISFAALFVKCLHYKPVKKESLVIMPAFGVQLEEHFWSGRVHRRFVPIGKILKPVLNECVTPVTCYWSLALLLRDEDELLLAFQKLHPTVKILVPIWKALCALTYSDYLNPSTVPRPNSSHKHDE